MIRIIATIYSVIGLIMAFLDSLDIVKLASMSFQTNLCALNGNINCVNDGISKMIIFAVDVILWPVYLATDFAQLGTIGAIIAVVILWFFFGRRK